MFMYIFNLHTAQVARRAVPVQWLWVLPVEMRDFNESCTDVDCSREKLRGVDFLEGRELNESCTDVSGSR
jgi:hypothetical protein